MASRTPLPVRRERGHVSQPLTPWVKSVMPHTSTGTYVDSVSDSWWNKDPSLPRGEVQSDCMAKDRASGIWRPQSLRSVAVAVRGTRVV